MVQELGGMLANWSPNVTVQTVPVKVSVCVFARSNPMAHRCAPTRFSMPNDALHATVSESMTLAT